MGTYRFVTTWRIAAPREQVWAALEDPEGYPQWWPHIEHAQVLDPGAPDGVGQHVRVTLRGRLPYRLHFETVVREVHHPERIVLDAVGDLQGVGRWDLVADGETTIATYTWQVATAKVWMRIVEPFVRPVFVWNHHAVMGAAARGLAAHLDARLVDEQSLPVPRLSDWVPVAGLAAGLAWAGRRAGGRAHRYRRHAGGGG